MFSKVFFGQDIVGIDFQYFAEQGKGVQGWHFVPLDVMRYRLLTDPDLAGYLRLRHSAVRYGFGDVFLYLIQRYHITIILQTSFDCLIDIRPVGVL